MYSFSLMYVMKFEIVTFPILYKVSLLGLVIHFEFSEFQKFGRMASSSAQGQVIGCHNNEEWTAHIQTNKLVVVDFTACWCGSSRYIAPFFDGIAKKMSHVIFLKVDIDELTTVAQQYKVETTPTFLFLKDGNEVDRVVGAKREELNETIAKHLPS
ncbi:thioredoxin H-type 1-like [Lycium barbarum]|uniref:thioredoxin H-type 1-like n=1 Tax=Lycium barbarum TaxID=112863 RepID=UPI00293E301B|nr:thioredoxin H-type 1-like [Lycium barbarum]